ncbi:MCP four helix bundle domain-containing protein [Neolewinella litorea]|uniref:Chemotaxis protein n=1 Tax=Neolewinella litorea TaxID=2562452 RepID=A0A4S4NSI7_9BACT|nr:MCP four helix bundle domain-containing protein [Neolewinella litorea]THH41421.1 chemotaxis protein [Neolewinella litorea]
MTSLNKIKWALGIALVFLLILTTNLVDRHNFGAVEETLETIYADRLVAHSIIFDLSELLREKEMAYARLSGPDLASATAANQQTIRAAIDRFADTKLTERESLVFERLRESVQHLEEKEDKFLAEDADGALLRQPVTEVRQTLRELSDIQLTEGQRQLSMGRKALGSVHLFTQLEIVALIVLAIIVQFIILYPASLRDEKDSYL